MNKTFLAALTVFVLASCASNEDLFITHNGNMPTNEKIAQVKVGQTKAQVEDILGSPSTVVALDRNTWLYMSADVERVAFFKPKEVDRDVLTLRFNKNDTLAKIERKTKQNGIEVAVDEDKTETLGHTPGFFERFFGGTQQYSPLGTGSSSGL